MPPPTKRAPAKAPAAKKRAAPRPRTATVPPEPATTVEALDLELSQLRATGPVGARLARSTLALSARRLAQEMDSPENSATSKSMCARVLLDTMDRLRELTPAAKENDAVDQLEAKRQARLARRPAP